MYIFIGFLSSACIINMPLHLEEGRYSANHLRSLMKTGDRGLDSMGEHALSVSSILFKKNLAGAQHWQMLISLPNSALNACMLVCDWPCHSWTNLAISTSLIWRDSDPHVECVEVLLQPCHELGKRGGLVLDFYQAQMLECGLELIEIHLCLIFRGPPPAFHFSPNQ